MKAKPGKPFSALLAGAFLFSAAALVPSNASAGHRHGGDRGWATAGKILTGFVAADILCNHIYAPPAVVYAPPPPVVYIPQPVVYAPAPPVVVVPPPAVVMAPPPVVVPAKVWHDGHYERVIKKVWVDTSYVVEEWQQGYRRPDGVWVDAHKIRRTVPSGYWQDREEQVWVEGHYE